MTEKQKTYYVIGLMSGSSLDGVDLAYCKIQSGGQWKYKILHAKTYPYNEGDKDFLKKLRKRPVKEAKTHDDLFGFSYAVLINRFRKEFNIRKLDFIASHGHTTHHHPEKKITLQLGSGKQIAKLNFHPAVTNFRVADIKAGGQGAPLVPVCDAYFFSQYDACLNIGGIANISYMMRGERIGFDICPANQLLDNLAQKLNKPFDKNGAIAKKGKINNKLMVALEKKRYFSLDPPKSLDNTFVEKNFMKTINEARCSVADKMRTVVERIAIEIAGAIIRDASFNQSKLAKYKLLVTGGGAYNKFLLQRIEKLARINIQLPDDETIQYKEALAMCLMGVLRWENKPNFLPSVTGAKKAVSGGEIFNP
ncbi:MAG: anhydro-N-acetylmuramic acid kinase [Chitinophagales bacterium]